MLVTRSEGLSALLEMKTLADVGGPLKREKGVDTAVLDRSANTDEALCYVTYLIFDRPHSLILN